MDPPPDRPTAKLLRVRVFANSLIPNRSSSQRRQSSRNDRLVCLWTVTNWVYPFAEEPCFALCLPFLALCKKIERIFADCVLLRSLAISSLLARALFVCHRIHRKKNRYWRATSEQSRMLRCKKSDYITHVYDHGWKLLQEQRDDRIPSEHSVEIARYFRCPRETRRNVRENLSKNAISNKCIRVKREYEYSFTRS